MPDKRSSSGRCHILIIVLICTGIVIWDQYFYPLTSIEQKRWAILVHALAAVTIICVWIVHVYAAIWVRGTIGAMTRGQVTGGWAWRHHRKWLKELVTGRAEDRSHRSEALRLNSELTPRHVIAWPVWLVRFGV